MVEQDTTVVAIEGDLLILEAETRTSCQSCSVSKGCGTSVLAKWVGKKFTRFSAPNTVNAVVGDQVVVGLSESVLLRGSMMIYMVPLLGMLVFALLADVLLVQEAALRDLIVAAMGVMGFGVALLVCRQYLSTGRFKQQLSPVVLRKIIGHGRITP